MNKFAIAQAAYDAQIPEDDYEYDWDTIEAKWAILESGGTVCLAQRGAMSYKELKYSINHFDDIEDFAERFDESQKIYNEYD